MSTTLLLADDSPTIAKILGMALQSEAYQIKSVLTAADAITELQANPPFFFLVDLTLPEKNGYDFAKFLRIDAKFSKTRVVLLASAFEPVDDALFQASGADAVIVKPFDPSDLRAKLRQLLDLPPKFPAGSKVQGAVSGQTVSAPSAPPPAAEPDLLAGLGVAPSADADSILSSLMGETAETPPAAPPLGRASPVPDTTYRAEKTSASIMLDLSEGPPVFQPAEPVLDFSDIAAEGNKTAMIERSKLDESPEDVLGALLGTKEEKLPPMPTADAPLSANAQALSEFFAAELKKPESPPPAPKAAPEAPPPAPAAKAPAAPKAAPAAASAAEPLSANAQALAAFFSAEISQKSPAPPPAAAAEPDGDEAAFDASLDSIDWATPPEASLNEWSSNTVAPEQPSPAPTAASAAAPVSPARAKAKAMREVPISASPLFDTGGSNFRFSDDYVTRITRSFTGAVDEHVPPQQPNAQAEEPVFRHASHDAPRAAAKMSAPSAAGGGAWSDAELHKVEQLVREEVQMVVREVVEKVAWEVIPELAENLIKKELEKVLKQLEP
jgi:CheY-like chemotaxis protein